MTQAKVIFNLKKPNLDLVDKKHPFIFCIMQISTFRLYINKKI